MNTRRSHDSQPLVAEFASGRSLKSRQGQAAGAACSGYSWFRTITISEGCPRHRASPSVPAVRDSREHVEQGVQRPPHQFRVHRHSTSHPSPFGLQVARLHKYRDVVVPTQSTLWSASLPRRRLWTAARARTGPILPVSTCTSGSTTILSCGSKCVPAGLHSAVGRTYRQL